MNLMSIYQETAKANLRTALQLQKAADKMTQNFIEATIVTKDASGTALKEYVNNFYQTRQEVFNKVVETTEKSLTDYPFKKEIEEFNSRTAENTKKVFELFSFPVVTNTKK